MTATHPRVLATAASLVVLLSGCGDHPGSDRTARPATPPTTSSGQTAPVDLPTNGWEQGEAAEEALISGTLSVDRDGCVYLAQVGGGERTYVTWPAGYSATLDTRGLGLHDDRGAEVARDGDSAEMGGGYGSEAAGSHPCLPAGQDEVGAVQSAVVVTASAPRDATLPCPPDRRARIFFDASGPGRPVPAAAVAPLLGRSTVGLVRRTGAHATVIALDASGNAVREYSVTRAGDGWWPDGYATCQRG